LSKAHGGADKLAHEMHAWDADWAWYTTDISKLDQRLQPGLLTMIFAHLCFLYEDDGSVEYKMLKALIAYASDDIASTYIKWTDAEYRLIIGVMFSGLYGTSWGDTIYVIIMLLLAFMNYTRDRVKRGLARPTTNPVVKVYGDNIFIGWKKEYLKEFVIPPAGMPYLAGFLPTYLDKVWGCPIKEDETGYYENFFSRITERYDSENRVVITLDEKGPVFLKRYFIERKYLDARWAMPFRPSFDHYAKSITSASAEETMDVWVSRWMGLILDSMGTNTEVYNYFMYLFGRFIHDYRDGGSYDWQAMVDLHRDISDEGKSDREWESRLHKMGFREDVSPQMNTQGNLRAMFCPEPYIPFERHGLASNV